MAEQCVKCQREIGAKGHPAEECRDALNLMVADHAQEGIELLSAIYHYDHGYSTAEEAIQEVKDAIRFKGWDDELPTPAGAATGTGGGVGK